MFIPQILANFCFRKLAPGDTVNIWLKKNGQRILQITDSSLGSYYDGFTEQPLYIGWLANWKLIFDAYRGGSYTVEAGLTILGNSSTVESRIFSLNSFDYRLAYNTVKIESYQSGNIINSPFDFTNLITGGWYSSVRVPGEMIVNAPTLEVDKFQNTAYNKQQNREKIIENYTLNFYDVNFNTLRELATNKVLANSVQITSYNPHLEQNIQRLSVAPEAFDSLTQTPYGRFSGSIKFTNRKDDIIKRNY